MQAAFSGQGTFLGTGIAMGGMVDETAYWQTQSYDIQIITNAATIWAATKSQILMLEMVNKPPKEINS